MDWLARVGTLLRHGQRAALVTVVETRGSTPRKAGARMVVLEDGRIEGTVGGGSVEHVLQSAAVRVLGAGAPELVTYRLTQELGMCCGGTMTFFVEPIMQAPTLLVFGCGHVGTALVHAAAPLGFDIIAIDDLPENLAVERLPQASRTVASYHADDIRALPFGADTYVVIATREHSLDQRLLEVCLTQPSRFLGVIGSVRKARMQEDRLRAKGFGDADLARVRCPVGIDVGAETPEEIAVSICAALIAARRGGPR